MKASEPLYLELANFVASGSTSEDVANFRPPAEVQRRVAELMERERESQLTAEGAAELNAFEELEQIVGLAKPKLD